MSFYLAVYDYVFPLLHWTFQES